MEQLLVLAKDFGWGLVMVVFAIGNAKEVGAFFELIFSSLSPALKERFEAKRAREAAEAKFSEREFELRIRERLATLEAETQTQIKEAEESARERIETIMTLKEVLREYREELHDAKRARENSEIEVRMIIKEYAQLSTQNVAIFQDVTEVMGRLVCRIETLLERQN